MKKIILFLTILLLTGCNSYTELNDLSIVNTLGIDYKDNNYNINLSIIEKDNNNSIIKTYSSKSKNFNKAINNIYLTSNKKLYLSHIDLLILTPNSINYKLDNILNELIKNNEYRNNFLVVLMNEESFNKFFETNKEANDITNLIKINSKETSYTEPKELETFLKEILANNNSYLPTISFKNDNLNIEGFTLVRDKKIYKTLSIEDSILLNILKKHSNKTYIDNINIYNSNIKITNKKNIINIDLYLNTDTNDKKKINKLKKRIYSFLDKYKEIDYDILGLKELVKKNNYNYYKKENNLLKKLDFKIKIYNTKQDNYIKE